MMTKPFRTVFRRRYLRGHGDRQMRWCLQPPASQRERGAGWLRSRDNFAPSSHAVVRNAGGLAPLHRSIRDTTTDNATPYNTPQRSSTCLLASVDSMHSDQQAETWPPQCETKGEAFSRIFCNKCINLLVVIVAWSLAVLEFPFPSSLC